MAYHDSDNVNQLSTTIRPGSGVDANELGLGWIYAGEWLNYTVNVANAGDYVLSMALSNTGNGGILHVEFNGVNKTGAISVPNTGGWGSTAQTVSRMVNLSAGQQVMRIRFDTNATSGFVTGVKGGIVFTPIGTG